MEEEDVSAQDHAAIVLATRPQRRRRRWRTAPGRTEAVISAHLRIVMTETGF